MTRMPREREIVVASVEDNRRGKGEPTGHMLVELLQNSPLQNVRIERRQTRGPVRDVEL